MPLETGSVIGDLDESWPLGGDPTNKGDDHLRLIKSVLISQFPGVGGAGLEKVIIATEDELNYLTGTVSNIAADIKALQDDSANLGVNLSAPKDTIMTFTNISVPLGWTQVTNDVNDYMMRIVNTAGGGRGGTQSPFSFNWAHQHNTAGYKLGTDDCVYLKFIEVGRNKPDGISNGIVIVPPDGTQSSWIHTGEDGSGTQAFFRANLTGAVNAHDHGATDSGNLVHVPKYINMILGIKD